MSNRFDKIVLTVSVFVAIGAMILAGMLLLARHDARNRCADDGMVAVQIGGTEWVCVEYQTLLRSP